MTLTGLLMEGLLVGILGTAIEIGELRGILAFVFALIGFKLKAALEERLMEDRFGAEYIDYERHVKFMIPWVW